MKNAASMPLKPSFVLGVDRFTQITKVEGLTLSRDIEQMLETARAQGASPEAQRALIAGLFRKDSA